MFDSKIKRNAHKNNRKTRKQKQLAKIKHLVVTTYVSKYSVKPKEMTNLENNNNNAKDLNINKNDGNSGNNGYNIGGGMSCHNSQRYLTHMVRPQRNIRQTEMKSRLLQINYSNPFARSYYEDPYTHLINFYELFGTRGAPKAEEEIFMSMFPYSLIGRADEWYLDKTKRVMFNWNLLEETNFEQVFSP